MPHEVVTPNLGEIVLLVPQAFFYLMSPSHPDNVIGGEATNVPTEPDTKTPDRIPHWTRYTSTLLRKGFGVLVVRDSKLHQGPSDWDSGD